MQRDAGYGVVRNYTGHGVGTRLHEDPRSSKLWKSGAWPKGAVGHDHSHRADDN